MSSNLFARLLIAAALACTASAGLPTTAVAGPSVYFVGVDAEQAREEGRQLVEMLGGDPRDRWALTEDAKKIARSLGNESVALDLPIDRWDPASDPYNFGVIAVDFARQTTRSWNGTSSRTLTTIGLTWMHIGHDQGTRMLDEKVPELRYSLSTSVSLLSDDPSPPDAPQLKAYYRRSFDAAVRQLLVMSRRSHGRSVDRSAADLRYVIVTTPTMSPSAMTAIVGLADSSLLADAAASYVQYQLMQNFENDERFDHVVLLPGTKARDYLQSEWSAFARRVASLSTYNAAWQAAGFRPPRLLRAVPLCVEPKENEVHALEIRAAIADVRWDSLPERPLVESVTVGAYLAADVKLPTVGESSVRALENEQAPIVRMASLPRIPKPHDIPINEFLGGHSVFAAVGNAAIPLSAGISDRLLAIIQTKPPLSHPSYQGLCSEH